MVLKLIKKGNLPNRLRTTVINIRNLSLSSNLIQNQLFIQTQSRRTDIIKANVREFQCERKNWITTDHLDFPFNKKNLTSNWSRMVQHHTWKFNIKRKLVILIYNKYDETFLLKFIKIQVPTNGYGKEIFVGIQIFTYMQSLPFSNSRL